MRAVAIAPFCTWSMRSGPRTYTLVKITADNGVYGIGEAYGCAEPLRASSVGPLAGTLPGEPITIQITTAIMIAART